jgi:hypothetical protein
LRSGRAEACQLNRKVLDFGIKLASERASNPTEGLSGQAKAAVFNLYPNMIAIKLHLVQDQTIFGQSLP